MSSHSQQPIHEAIRSPLAEAARNGESRLVSIGSPRGDRAAGVVTYRTVTEKIVKCNRNKLKVKVKSRLPEGT